MLLATSSASGFPRVSPIEPVFGNGDLYLGMAAGTRKAADMYRDARILVHNVVTRRYGDEGEVKLRAYAVPLRNQRDRDQFADLIETRISWRPSEPYDVFAVDVVSISFVVYDPQRNHERSVELWRA